MPDSQLGPNGPEIGEERLVEGGGQVLRSGAPASTAPSSDSALHHFHMAVSPFHHAFVQIDETLAELGQSRVIAIDLDQDALQVGRRLDWPAYVALQK